MRPDDANWILQLVLRDGMRAMNRGAYPRKSTENSQLYAYTETLGSSALSAFKLYLFRYNQSYFRRIRFEPALHKPVICPIFLNAGVEPTPASLVITSCTTFNRLLLHARNSRYPRNECFSGIFVLICLHWR